MPTAACAIRPIRKRVIRYKDVTPDELFEAARLVVAAEIAKIHTIEWTPQLLYDEPLYKGMNANWNGLLGHRRSRCFEGAVRHCGTRISANRQDVDEGDAVVFGVRFRPGHLRAGQQSSALRHHESRRRQRRRQSLRLAVQLPRRVRYRLPAASAGSGPDRIPRSDKDPNQIAQKVAVIDTFEGKATDAMRSRGLANWGLSMGRQRLGLLTLHNHPQFMQNITLPRLDSADAADRHRGARPDSRPRARRAALQRIPPAVRPAPADQLRRFHRPALPADSPARKQQMETVAQLREVYGTHVCDASKVITDAQLNEDGTPINDCLGHPNGSVVDNIEDVDTVVGWLAESTRPHGFAISETQFVVFILNASRRLFSDRFFTSSFRPEFYTTLGIDWVNHNGPGRSMMETGNAERTHAAGLAAEARAAAQHSGAGARVAARGQRLRSVGARPRPVLLAGVEAAAGRCIRSRHSSSRWRLEGAQLKLLDQRLQT